MCNQENTWLKDFEYSQYFNRYVPYPVYHAIYSLLGYKEKYTPVITVIGPIVF